MPVAVNYFNSTNVRDCVSHCQKCVFITAVPITKLFARGGGGSGGHVVRETTSRGLSELMMMMPFHCSFRNKNEPPAIYPSLGYSPPQICPSRTKVCVLLLPYLLQSCSRGGGGGSEDDFIYNKDKDKIHAHGFCQIPQLKCPFTMRAADPVLRTLCGEVTDAVKSGRSQKEGENLEFRAGIRGNA